MLQDRLIALVKEILAKNSIDRPLSPEIRLADAGLSSLDMVNLMFAIEAEFNLEIPSAEITPENFHSVSTIEALLTRLGAS